MTKAILSREYQGSLYAIASGLMYGFVGYYGVSLINTDMSIASLQFWRFCTAALFMCVILIPQYKTVSDKKREMVKAFLSGALFYSMSAGMYFLATQYIGTGQSMVILFTFPAIVMLLNRIFYKIIIPKMVSVAAILIMVGMVVLVDLTEFSFNMTGIGLAAMGALLYAFYIIVSKNIQISPMISTLMISLGCSAACLAFSLYDDSFIFPVSLYQWIHIIGFGIFSTAVPILLLLQGLKMISAEKASILSVLEPVFVVLFGIILLGENFTLLQMFGMLMILGGALIALFSSKPQRA